MPSGREEGFAAPGRHGHKAQFNPFRPGKSVIRTQIQNLSSSLPRVTAWNPMVYGVPGAAVKDKLPYLPTPPAAIPTPATGLWFTCCKQFVQRCPFTGSALMQQESKWVCRNRIWFWRKAIAKGTLIVLKKATKINSLRFRISLRIRYQL